jgi:hypothetical protein
MKHLGPLFSKQKYNQKRAIKEELNPLCSELVEYFNTTENIFINSGKLKGSKELPITQWQNADMKMSLSSKTTINLCFVACTIF